MSSSPLFLCPDRPRLGECRARAAALRDAAEAWEALAPAAWRPGGARRRRFIVAEVLARSEGAGGTSSVLSNDWIVHDGLPLRTLVSAPRPASVRDVVALCGDPVGVAAAEGLAAEAVGCFGETPRRFLWRIDAPTEARRRLGRWWRPLRKPHRLRNVDCLEACARYAFAAMLGLYEGGLAPALEPERFWRPGTRPDPLGPLRGLWRLGYALESVGRGDVILYAPALDAPP